MMKERRGGGGEERRGLNRCEWVLQISRQISQEPLVPARARRFFNSGAAIFWVGRAFFGRIFGGAAFFFGVRPTHFWKIRRAHFFPPRPNCRP